VIRKTLLVVTAAVEAGAGVALMVVPSWAAELLLGDSLSSPASLVVARIGGSALLSIAVACWLGRAGDRRECSGLIVGVSIYNLAVLIVLVLAVFVQHLDGILLWPAVVLHAALAVWCFVERAS
jgi:hypothetical protein